MRRLAALALVLWPATASALAPADAARLIAAARELIGTPYEFGGRMRVTGEGVDCQGVLFLSAQRLSRCSWRSFSVFPTKSVARGELGRRVPGLDPVATESLDLARLKPGDVLLLVGPMQNSKEPAIGRIGRTPVWVWHTGLYSGDGRWIVGDHYAGRVVETELQPYLQAHRDVYSGVFVTRMATGPAPFRRRGCR